jgi:hypothetical protein
MSINTRRIEINPASFRPIFKCLNIPIQYLPFYNGNGYPSFSYNKDNG